MSDTDNTVNTQAVGNTKNNRSRNWCFTWNNYEQNDIETMKKFIGENCEIGVFQEETGKNGTKHLQGVMCFKNARFFSALKKQFPRTHLEGCLNKRASIKYCQKEDTRTGNVYKFGDVDSVNSGDNSNSEKITDEELEDRHVFKKDEYLAKKFEEWIKEVFHNDPVYLEVKERWNQRKSEPSILKTEEIYY